MRLINTTPSFGKSHINSSQMNMKQNNMTDLILNKIDYNDEYKKSDENNVDLYFIPEGKRAINVYCVDVKSQQIIKDNKNKNLKFTFSADSGAAAFLKQINILLNSLRGINTNEFKRPEVQNNLIANALTDVAVLRPELYENIQESTDNYIEYCGLEREDAYSVAAEDFISDYEKTNTNDDF